VHTTQETADGKEGKEEGQEEELPQGQEEEPALTAPAELIDPSG
jgi:hypothetical protein